MGMCNECRLRPWPVDCGRHDSEGHALSGILTRAGYESLSEAQQAPDGELLSLRLMGPGRLALLRSL